jgi:hypothetical protein
MPKINYRYKKGGPHKPSYKYGSGSVPYNRKSERLSSSIQIQMRMDWDDAPFYTALDKMGFIGRDVLKEDLKKLNKKGIESARRMLKKKAGALAGKGFLGHKNIWETVGDALVVQTVPGSEFLRVHAGGATASKSQQEEGVMGSRGGRIAQIVANGQRSFPYGNLPYFVQSSVWWYTKLGLERDISMFMQSRVYHPGFDRTFDYMSHIADYVDQRAENQFKLSVERMALKSGFRTE